ncbi:MAG: SDR family NAD(P)-dependent oxidoreductase [Clostridia bacterium]|nr:SDR family NAD(P)-dependent oxidoreductase [Clostridia bacterium]
MKIAIVTGASSGIGVEFYKEIQKEPLDEVWIIARREERLKDISEKFGVLPTKIIPMDITLQENVKEYIRLLKENDADIRFLINNAGFGVIGELADADFIQQGAMCDLNVRAMTQLTTASLGFMNKGACIINTCSISSFVPNARMTVYSASKAFVMSFTKSLRYELKKRKINVTALCPGPMDTEFLAVAGIKKGVSKTFDKLPRCNPRKSAIGAIKAAKKGRCVYTPKLFYKFYRVIAKILPCPWLLGAAKT